MLTRVQEEKAMDSNQCQDRTSTDGTDGSGCTYSSHSTLPPCSEHSHDTPSRHETFHPFLYSTPLQNNQEQPVSRTQVLLTKIVKLCSEIRDIKNSQNKYHLCDKRNTRNNKTNLSKISDIHRSHNPVSLDTCVYHDQHGDNSSHNTPSSP